MLPLGVLAQVPDLATVVEHRGGDLGPVRLIHGGYLQDWLSTADDDNWRVDASGLFRHPIFAARQNPG